MSIEFRFTTFGRLSHSARQLTLIDVSAFGWLAAAWFAEVRS